MQSFVNLFGIKVSFYGLMLLVALLTGNLIVFSCRRRLCVIFDGVILMEAYMILGALIGAKLVYIAVSFKTIDWKGVFSSLDSFSFFLNSGFVFYGGLIGALLSLFWARLIHKCSFFPLLENVAFVLPLTHAIGRIGCLLVGCCYGIIYDGFLAIRYSWSPYPRFPVQLLEAFLLFLLFLSLLIYRMKDGKYSLEIYLISYSVIRFFTEFFRGDSERGVFLNLGLSQWISIAMFIFSFLLLFMRKQIAKRILR